jgi:acid stress-induced BolA-like protein IbaG/YrbA
MDPDEIGRLIEAAFDNATVKVVGDGAHFEALVIATEFEGLRTLARHQLIYKSLGELVGNEIHALSIKAMTPGEWQEQAGNPLG